MNDRIPYSRPSITQLEIDYALDAVENGWGEHCYDYIERFENAFKEYLGSDFAVATSSCTGALHLGLAALGVGPGDEVILADTNWVATVSPIVHLGAQPVFVDVLPDTWCIDPQQVEAAISVRTRAIIATHLYGNLADMDRLLQIGSKYKIPIIEDAAEAIGSSHQERKAGSMGLFGVFSFHGSKTLTTGEGGMLVTDDETVYELVLALNNHGRIKGETRQFWPSMLGYKFKISNVQAAIGCAQVDRIAELIGRKREIFESYHSGLGHCEGLQMNPEPDGTVNGYWMPTVVFDKSLGLTRDRILAAFRSQNIDARVFFSPLSSLDMFESQKQNSNSYSIAERAINLPSFHDITFQEIERVIAVVRDLAS